jgi:tripartite ATP-independent transporter DctM subunit
MSAIAVGYIGIAVLIILMFLGLPIAVCFGTVGFLGLWAVKGLEAALGVLAVTPYMWASHYVLMAIPLFVLMGYFSFRAGISTELYDCAYKWIGHIPGGIAISTILACAGFGATSGSSLATSGAMGAVAIPEMNKHGYSKALAAGSVAAGGTLGILIPPSLCFIVYGTIVEESITKLFIAGILPGILLTLAFVAVTLIQVGINPEMGPAGPCSSWKQRLYSLKATGLMAVLFILLIGGLFVGAFTPTEGAAIGAMAAFIITLFRKRISMRVIIDSLHEAGKTTCMIFILYICAMMYMSFLALTGLPYQLSAWVATLGYAPWIILAIILLIYIPLGMLMDPNSMLVLTLPIFYPIVNNLGIDGIWFGVLVVVVVELGLITPPVGINVFVLRGATDIPLYSIFRGVIPFVIADVIVLIILFIFPKISLYLPQLMMGR